MTLATEGTDTVTTVAWQRHNSGGTNTLYTGKRSGWTFTIQGRKNHVSTLVADHTNGRSFLSDHADVRAAKAAALELMHPSEAMGWGDDWSAQGRRYSASWGSLYFLAVQRPDGRLRFAYRENGGAWQGADTLDGRASMRQAARDVLCDHYGPVPEPSAGKPQAAPAAPAEERAEAWAQATHADALAAAMTDVRPVDADDVSANWLLAALAAAGLVLAPAE